MAIKNGGPAFPRPAFSPSFPYQGGEHGQQEGMSLRDWFAGQALQGLLAGNHELTIISNPIPRVAEEAYAYADAMLKEQRAGA